MKFLYYSIVTLLSVCSIISFLLIYFSYPHQMPFFICMWLMFSLALLITIATSEDFSKTNTKNQDI